MLKSLSGMYSTAVAAFVVDGVAVVVVGSAACATTCLGARGGCKLPRGTRRVAETSPLAGLVLETRAWRPSGLLRWRRAISMERMTRSDEKIPYPNPQPANLAHRSRCYAYCRAFGTIKEEYARCRQLRRLFFLQERTRRPETPAIRIAETRLGVSTEDSRKHVSSRGLLRQGAHTRSCHDAPVGSSLWVRAVAAGGSQAGSTYSRRTRPQTKVTSHMRPLLEQCDENDSCACNISQLHQRQEGIA